jgi:nitrogen regulatory protein PII
MKKIEIIIDYVILNKVVQKLDELKVEGYTIIKEVMGKGSQGNKDGHGVLAGFKNCYIMMVLPDNEVENIVTAITPLINSFGGLCIIDPVDRIITRKTSK